MSEPGKIALFYDSQCPVCNREAAWLKRHDRNNRLGLIDLATADTAELPAGLNHADLMRVLHARLPDGTIVTRLAAARAVYEAIGRGWMMRWTAWPPLRPVMEALYSLFARNRVSIGRFLGAAPRCQAGSCAIDRR